MELIDLDETIDALCELWCGRKNSECHMTLERDGAEECESILWLRERPKVDHVKHGKWIRHVLKNANVPWGYDCSACGAWFVISEDAAERYNYCCGARMDGE